MTEPKNSIICPVCGKTAKRLPIYVNPLYRCDECGFLSSDENVVNISYGDPRSASLSNLYPHEFILYGLYPTTNLSEKQITCPSMESFLQGLKIQDKDLQNIFMRNYSGMAAYKMSAILNDWKDSQTLWFNGIPYNRYSDEYTELITKAYDALFETNVIFREIVLPKFKDKILIHTTGKDSESDTILTEAEFRYQLNRLMKRL